MNDSSATSEMSDAIGRLENRVDQLYYLVIGGGKESRVVETVPAWRKDECDDKCQFTETPIPKGRLVKVGNLRVHPGVKAYVESEGIPDLEDYEGTVPGDYLAVPPVTRLRKVYRPTPRIEWTPEELKTLSRASIAIIARDQGLATVCKMINPKLDWRFEKREWLAEACLRLRDHTVEEVAKTIKFGSSHNKEILADGPKPQSGGTKKTKSKAKSTEKKPKAKPKSKAQKAEEKAKKATEKAAAPKKKDKSKDKKKKEKDPK